MNRVSKIVEIYVVLLLVVVATLFVSCVAPTDSHHRVEGTVSIAYLKSLCREEQYTIVGDCYIEGVVVASDWMGEMHKSIVVVDDSAGVEIAIESEDIALWLPIYSKVKIYCGGLTLARVGGKVQLGAAPTQDFLVDNIEESLAQSIIQNRGVAEDIPIELRTIAEFCDEDISRMVQLNGLRLIDEEVGLSWCDFIDGEAQTTVRTVVDDAGNRCRVRTLATCSYADKTVPAERFSVVAILDAAEGEYLLRIINGKIF